MDGSVDYFTVIHYGDGLSGGGKGGLQRRLASGSAIPQPHQSNSSSQQDFGYSKFKGINLHTQTMLPIATADVIISALNFLDGNKIAHSNNNQQQQINEANIGDNEVLLSQNSSSVAGKYLTNSRLYAFIEAADPTQSFFDLSLVLDEPVEEVLLFYLQMIF